MANTIVHMGLQKRMFVPNLNQNSDMMYIRLTHVIPRSLDPRHIRSRWREDVTYGTLALWGLFCRPPPDRPPTPPPHKAVPQHNVAETLSLSGARHPGNIRRVAMATRSAHTARSSYTISISQLQYYYCSKYVHTVYFYVQYFPNPFCPFHKFSPLPNATHQNLTKKFCNSIQFSLSFTK